MYKELEGLQKLIQRKKRLISKRQEELQELEKEYSKERESECSILMFSFDTTCPMPDDESEYTYQYIYYLADLNIFEYISTDFLRLSLPRDANIIDFRDSFKGMGIPKSCWPENPYIKYYDLIKRAAIILKEIIDNILENNQIDSWKELHSYIKCNRGEIDSQVKKLLNYNMEQSNENVEQIKKLLK